MKTRTQHQIDQLEIVTHILRSGQANIPVEWEWKSPTDGLWYDRKIMPPDMEFRLLAEGIELRFKPKPAAFIDLSPEDITPGSVFRLPTWTTGCHRAYDQVQQNGVTFQTGVSRLSFAELRRDGWLIHRPGTGVWVPCQKDAHSPAALDGTGSSQ